MHYVTRRSNKMQKHNFSVMCPDALFIETAWGPPEQENSALTFRAQDAPECTT
jgi:hypothetical protein